MSCPCGEPLHYNDPDVRRFVDQQIASLGPTVHVTTPEGTWAVPRHFIALHGVKAAELPSIAAAMGFEQVG